MTATKLHFSRFEFKYLLPGELRKEVEGELAHFVELDPFVRRQESQKYLVRSLYWDDEALTAFHDKNDGVMHRSKFRLRTYAFDASDLAPCFLEIKGRHNNLVFKHRTPVNIGPDTAAAKGDSLTELVGDRMNESPMREQFLFQRFRRRIRPYALIDYVRRPYISKFDPEFRLTFDEQLQATETACLFPGRSARTRRIAPGSTVMELKFRHHVPSWFHRIIQTYELRRRSFSKICEGTVALGLGDDDA